MTLIVDLIKAAAQLAIVDLIRFLYASNLNVWLKTFWVPELSLHDSMTLLDVR